jgi:TrmH family RNA methyltransferase
MQNNSIITSRKNPKIQLLRSLTKDKNIREKCGLVVCEGEKLLDEAVTAGLAPKEIFVTEKKLLSLQNPASDKVPNPAPVTVITDDIAEYISSVKSNQGIFFLLKPLDKFNFCDIISTVRCVIILEDLQDPGNVGTIIRTCEAFGVELLLLSENSADVNSPKVIRSSAGSVFRVPICSVNISEAIKTLKDNKFTVYAAMPDTSAIPLRKLPKMGKIAVVIGNEGGGITKETAEICTNKVCIPMKSVQSLNAATAAAIIIYETGV